MFDKANLWTVDIYPLLRTLEQGLGIFHRDFWIILVLTLIQVLLIVVATQNMLILICATKAGLNRLENDPEFTWVSTLGHWLYLSKPKDAPEQLEHLEKQQYHPIDEAEDAEGIEPSCQEFGMSAVCEGTFQLGLGYALLTAYYFYVSYSEDKMTSSALVATILLGSFPLLVPFWILQNHRLACTLGWVLWMNSNIVFLFQHVTAMFEWLFEYQDPLWLEFVVRKLIPLFGLTMLVGLPICRVIKVAAGKLFGRFTRTHEKDNLYEFMQLA